MNDLTDNQAVVILIVLGFFSMFVNVWIDNIHSIASYLLLSATIGSLITALVIISKDDKEKKNEQK